MRSRMTIAVAALFILTSVVQAQKMVVDVDKAVDFTKFKTYGWAAGAIAPKAATSEVIIAAIEREMNARGLVRNDADHDVQIAVMAAADIDLQGVGPTWNNEVYRSWGGYGNPAALMNVTKGTLLVDLIQTKSKHSIWRGVVKDVFVQAPSGNPAKDHKQMESLVNKTVSKMFKKYPVNP